MVYGDIGGAGILDDSTEQAQRTSCDAAGSIEVEPGGADWQNTNPNPWNHELDREQVDHIWHAPYQRSSLGRLRRVLLVLLPQSASRGTLRTCFHAIRASSQSMCRSIANLASSFRVRRISNAIPCQNAKRLIQPEDADVDSKLLQSRAHG